MSTHTDDTSNTPAGPAHIMQLRALMMEQLRALRSAPQGDALEQELKRAKGVSEVAQTLINSAKVEVDYLRQTHQDRSDFLETPPDPAYAHLGHSPGPANGISSITRHRLQG
jgi:hypothetical protein